MNIVKDHLVGRTRDGEKFFITVEIRENNRESVSVDHNPITGYRELSITGTLISKYGSIINDRGWISCGQNIDDLRRVTLPANGITRAGIDRIVTIWQEWHLNGMESHCAHQDKAIAWDKVPSCPVTGYRAGSAWLSRELPDNIERELVALLSPKLVAA